MKLHAESSLSLNDLKGAFVVKENKDGTEQTYKIYDFSIAIDPSWDNPDDEDEMTGYELSDISVILIPIIDGKLNKKDAFGRSFSDFKDYQIQLAGPFQNFIE